ncbi:hypothetical protein [Sphingomonas adhaesiva]|uniref:hypothetical protein n=1 Tax=Sphingomonas adhaesiva TaxID=28212 RepID=UPI002FFB8371
MPWRPSARAAASSRAIHPGVTTSPWRVRSSGQPGADKATVRRRTVLSAIPNSRASVATRSGRAVAASVSEGKRCCAPAANMA